MTRREFLFTAATAASPAPLIVPIRQVMDIGAKGMMDEIWLFASTIWPQTVRDFAQCGIRFQRTQAWGEVVHTAGGRPVFTGLERGVLNLVLTASIPAAWDGGRGLAGVTMRFDGYHLCVIALSRAHGHRVPFLSVNTCVHELLHALLLDIFEDRPPGLAGYAREFRVDSYATRLWLFHDCADIRQSAGIYLDRLRAEPRQ